MKRNYKGFSLIEILVAIALIAILAAITIIAVDPAKLMAKGRNGSRRDAVSQIFSAVNQYLTEEGNSIAGLGTIPNCTDTPGSVDIGTGVGLVDLTGKTDLSKIPMDPQYGSAEDTHYSICKTSATKVRVAAVNPELNETIVAE